MLAGAGLHRRDVLARHGAAHDLVLELEALAARERPDLQLHVAELAMATGLLLVPAVRLGALADGLAIGRARKFGATSTLYLFLSDRGPRAGGSPLTPEQRLVGLRSVSTRSAGSSSVSLAKALESLTSSLRLAAVTAKAYIGRVAGGCGMSRGRPLHSDAPVRAPSRRASATISPASAEPIFCCCPPNRR